MEGQRPDETPRRAEFGQDDAQRNERKCAQPLHRQEESKQFAPDEVDKGLGHRQPQQKTNLG